MKKFKLFKTWKQCFSMEPSFRSNLGSALPNYQIMHSPLFTAIRDLHLIERFESRIVISSGESIFSIAGLNKFLKIPDTVSTLKGAQLMCEQTPYPKPPENIWFNCFYAVFDVFFPGFGVVFGEYGRTLIDHPWSKLLRTSSTNGFAVFLPQNVSKA